MKKVGIWIDSKQAHIVRIENNDENLETIDSNIEFFNRTSTGGTRVKSGVTQDITNESSYLEKEKNQFKNYFKTIAESISNSDEVVLFGPADINQKFKKELVEHYKPIAKKVTNVVKADSMTENQTVALVRDYFRQN